MERHNVIGVLGGSPELVRAWMAAAPGRFLAGLDIRFDRVTGTMSAPVPPGAPPRPLSLDEIRELHAAGKLAVLGELTNQYAGIAPDDARLEPLFALAEGLDIPVGIHIGGGEPETPYTAFPAFRARPQSALTLEADRRRRALDRRGAVSHTGAEARHLLQQRRAVSAFIAAGDCAASPVRSRFQIMQQ